MNTTNISRIQSSKIAVETIKCMSANELLEVIESQKNNSFVRTMRELAEFAESEESEYDVISNSFVEDQNTPMTVAVAVEKEKLEKPPLDLHYLGDKVLRQKAKRISKIDDSIRELAKEMLQTMYSSHGIGLAAPQVGVNKRLIVVDTDPENPNHGAMVLINPEITQFGKELCGFEEGCLSIPGVHLDVMRPDVIEVTYRDEFGKPKRIKASGLLSRVIQHEIDHLDGVMFVDRVDNQLALNEQLKESGFSPQAVKHLA